MASKNIIAKGTTYNGVESVTFPTSPSGDATFYEISDTTCTASDVLNSKYFYTAAGVKTQGTGTAPSPTLITKNITQNGTYNASSDSADGYSSVTVNVSGGGSNWTKIASETFTVSTTSTSNIEVGTINAGSSAYTSGKIMVVVIEDTAGPRTSHHLGTQAWFVNPYPASGTTSTLSTRGITSLYVNNNDKYGVGTSAYGVYAYSVTSSGNILIYARYSSSSTYTIDGDFQCDVYLLDWPDGTPLVPIV